jgi:predicted secreted protein
MSIMSAIVLYAMIWFLTLFIVLPLWTRTQGEAGDVVPGTHSSAPEDAQMWKIARLVTIWATGLFVIIAGIILSGVITMDMIERVTRPG